MDGWVLPNGRKRAKKIAIRMRGDHCRFRSWIRSLKIKVGAAVSAKYERFRANNFGSLRNCGLVGGLVRSYKLVSWLVLISWLVGWLVCIFTIHSIKV